MRLRLGLLIALASGVFAANVNSDEYLGIIKFLASPEMRGRATGSPELGKSRGLHSRSVSRHEPEADFGQQLLPGF